LFFKKITFFRPSSKITINSLEGLSPWVLFQLSRCSFDETFVCLTLLDCLLIFFATNKLNILIGPVAVKTRKNLKKRRESRIQLAHRDLIKIGVVFPFSGVSFSDFGLSRMIGKLLKFKTPVKAIFILVLFSADKVWRFYFYTTGGAK